MTGPDGACATRDLRSEAEVEAYRELEDTYQQIQAEIRSRSPRYASLTQPQPLSLVDVQTQVLDGETLLLVYALGEEAKFPVGACQD